MEIPSSYYRAALDSNSSENISFQSTAEDDLFTEPYAYIETPTLYSPASAKPGPFPNIAVKTGTPIRFVSGPFPTNYDRVKDYTNKKLNTSIGFIIAVCIAIVNFLFPVVKRTVCDVSVDRPSTLMRAFNFARRAFYVVDKNSLEEIKEITSPSLVVPFYTS
ncbi:hypothetical protein MFLAVUS_006913 [Mucor flavus]|uniref:Uncharacterized protein n=1 Tax=Mucor flavus TaxID=439312 RepID=A0ABP9Z2V1_9FUNG